MRRRFYPLIGTLVVAVLLSVPAAASAWSIHNYRVRDAGPEIVHKLTLCQNQGKRLLFQFVAYTETVDGGDPGFVRRTESFRRGCWRYPIVHNDDLRYRGWYYGRMRVRLLGASGASAPRYTSWKRFWSS